MTNRNQKSLSNLRDFVRLLRTRWVTICAVVAAATVVGVATNLLTTPLYESSTRLFVSTTSNTSVTDLYQGNLYSQQRVRSYTELLKGRTLAQRTIDRLGLNMDAAGLQKRIRASAKPDTVLITAAVLDESPVRARDIANALSAEFVNLVNELETPKPGAKPDARVVIEQNALVPGTPVVPKLVRNLTLSVALGILLGVALAVFRDHLDNTVKGQQDLEEITGVGVVGVIPFGKELESNSVIDFSSTNSRVAEAYRKLRTNLQFLTVDKPPRMIVISSAVPNEGKTTTALNIGLALAEADHNVLIVDGDLRKPSLAEYLGLIGGSGFSSVLSGAATIPEVLQATTHPRLTLMSSGATPPNPSELLGSLTAEKVLANLREMFEYVIIDSPPLVAVTDAAILAAKSDGVLLVSRFAKTRRDLVSQAMGNIESVGTSLLGSVLTFGPTGRQSGYYDYNYGYHSVNALQKIAAETDETPNPNGDAPKQVSAGAERHALRHDDT